MVSVPPDRMHVLVVTGLSGAGRSSALRVLEDLQYFCVDNLPPSLAPELVTLLAANNLKRVGLGIDVRTGSFLEGVEQALQQLTLAGYAVEVLFLDCSDEVVVRRFSETRRPHPVAGDGNVMEAIAQERDRLSHLRGRAKILIDTSALSVHDLRRALIDVIGSKGQVPTMKIRVCSFGFKYGIPTDADLVFDLRYLPNPHFVSELRPQTGLDAPVFDYVFQHAEAKQLLADIQQLLGHNLASYEREGKAYLTIALGCTGGKHRSVAFAKALVEWVSDSKRPVSVSHRDLLRT